jgi:hypothetical protein
MSLQKAARKGEESGRKHAASGAALTYENGIHHAKKAGFLSEDKINAFADGFVRAGKGSTPRTRKHAGKGKRRRNGHCASPRSPRYDASCDLVPGGAHDRLNRHVAGTGDGNIRDMRLFDAHWAAKGGHSPKGSHIPPRALTSGQHAYMDRAFYTPGLIGEAREQARHTSSQLRANKRKARLVFRKKR